MGPAREQVLKLPQMNQNYTDTGEGSSNRGAFPRHVETEPLEQVSGPDVNHRLEGEASARDLPRGSSRCEVPFEGAWGTCDTGRRNYSTWRDETRSSTDGPIPTQIGPD